MSNPSLCGSCSMTFSLLKRKNRCTACRLLYCSSCFKKGRSLPQRNAKHCLKCHAFSSEPFIPSELMLLSIKELKAFLQEHNVSAMGCTEKRDLVDVIINHGRPGRGVANESSSHDGAGAYRNTTPSSSSHNEPSQAQPSSSTTPNTSRHEPSSIFSQPEDFFGMMRDLTEGLDLSAGTSGNSGNPGLFHSLFVMDGDRGRARQAETSHSQSYGDSSMDYRSPSQAWSALGNKSSKSVRLEDFKNSNDLRTLTVKELKRLLDENFVDYKGCCEKEELVQRAMLLWQSKTFNETVSGESNEATGENDICKVCMDKVADCVLLECGHLVTCIDCGKRLRECPMCRQNIARIVRVFKS